MIVSCDSDFVEKVYSLYLSQKDIRTSPFLSTLVTYTFWDVRYINRIFWHKNLDRKLSTSDKISKLTGMSLKPRF